ncbi:hypothetical protein SLEP1_g19495 [Rubroshorea leprosula]|uniref:Oleosin n=1 Tax=Rubroshorea leprosula TaxID=152421 RepID=A0AAV5J8Q9_9ROSI|nr:hypothetical protein SLEP1_g19495 [Rubroshorea leprosula]
MADRPAPHQIQVHPQHHRFEGGRHYYPQEGPSASQILAVITLLPIGGTLLALAGLTLAGSVIGTLVSAPLFIIFSPVLVPAAIVIGLAVTGFLTSGAFGLTGLSSLSYVINCIRKVTGADQYSLDQAKSQVGLKIKDLGQGIQSKAHRIGD